MPDRHAALAWARRYAVEAPEGSPRRNAACALLDLDRDLTAARRMLERADVVIGEALGETGEEVEGG